MKDLSDEGGWNHFFLGLGLNNVGLNNLGLKDLNLVGVVFVELSECCHLQPFSFSSFSKAAIILVYSIFKAPIFSSYTNASLSFSFYLVDDFLIYCLTSLLYVFI